MIGGPIAAVPIMSASRSFDSVAAAAANVDVDPKMFENANGNNNNRASVVSGASSSDTTISTNSSGVNFSRFDSNGNREEEEEEEEEAEPLTPEEKQARQVFNIAREMMTSEQDFVGVLRLLNVDFREHITAAMK